MNKHELSALWTKICIDLTEIEMNEAAWLIDDFSDVMEYLYEALLELMYIALANIPL